MFVFQPFTGRRPFPVTLMSRTNVTPAVVSFKTTRARGRGVTSVFPTGASFHSSQLSAAVGKSASSRLIIRRPGGGDPFSSVWSFSLERRRKTPPTLLEPLLSSLAVTLGRSSPPPLPPLGPARPRHPQLARRPNLRGPQHLHHAASITPSFQTAAGAKLEDSANVNIFVPRWIL